MNYLEEIENQINEFIQHPPCSIILWGAGNCGKNCFEWLRKFELEGLVKGFVDSDINKWGTTFFDLPVQSPDWLTKESSASVIICTMFHMEIYDKIPTNSNRSIFAFEDRKNPYYQGELYDIPKAELYNLYRDDELTRTYLDLTLMMRKLFNLGGVIPYSLMKYVPLYCDYWNSEELSLSQYERITIVDGGAYTGDSIEYFNKILGKRLAKIYAIEPDVHNFSKLQSNVDALGLSDISHLICCGLSNANTQAPFSGGKGLGSTFMLSSGKDALDTMTLSLLDDIVQNIEGKLCIKMDIEGFELNALKGASRLIQQYKPELSICVYHKYDDILDIPKFIKTVVPEYNCILRGGPHLECYASVDRF